MRLSTAINAFSSQPWRTLLLALLVLLMAFLALSGWLPPSKKDFPGHEFLLAGLCAALALFFVICAVIGFRKNGNRAEHQ
jgi:quinol-cytochrome oxidoreductase complex cytochrome b subunit